MRVGIVAGEASGDVLGAGLIEALRAVEPGVRFAGVAGPRMRAAGCESWEDADALAVMGLIEPLREVPRLLRLRRELVRRWRAEPPDVFVGVDAPDFNLGLERKLRIAGVPTVHYVSPSVWAWRRRRIHKIRKAVDRMLCLLPFEKAFYDTHGVAADFVGHPLAETLPEGLDRYGERRALGIGAKRVVAVLPGSRRGEVSRLGPVFAATARLLAARYDEIAFVSPAAGSATRALFERALDDEGVRERFTVLDGQTARAVAAADCVLLASGTAALEAALLGRAIVAAYRLAPLTYGLARALRLVKVTHFTLPNLLTETPLVPEFLQGQASPEALAAAVASLLDDGERRTAIETAFATLRRQLARDADRQAARAVAEVARAGREHRSA